MSTTAPDSIASTAWHARPAADAVRDLEVHPPSGLSAADAQRRLEQYGRNQLAEAPKEPRWRAFLRQFQDLLIIILLIAAVVSLLVSREWETPIAIVLVVLLNAVIGFVQEPKAEASLDALRRMSVTTATVRRDGRIVRSCASGAGAYDQPGPPSQGRTRDWTTTAQREPLLPVSEEPDRRRPSG